MVFLGQGLTHGGHLSKTSPEQVRVGVFPRSTRRGFFLQRLSVLGEIRQMGMKSL